MGRAPGDERYSEWTFTETLCLDDVELRERQEVDETGELRVVPYAHSIQGRETSKITYRGLRKICSYLGVRYYKNRPKDMMTELIAVQKLRGQVPESYRKKRTLPAVELERQHDFQHQETERMEHQSPPPTEETLPLFISDKRQRVATDEGDEPTITTNVNAPNAFLQPVSPTESDHHSPPTDYDSGIPTTPTEPQPPRIHVEMTLTDRVDTFNLLRHIRQQIQHVEDEIVAHSTNDAARASVKAQRLSEDLQFYLAERRSLVQQLENSR